MLHDGPSPGTMNGPSPDTNSPLHGLNYAIGTGNSLGRDRVTVAGGGSWTQARRPRAQTAAAERWPSRTAAITAPPRSPARRGSSDAPWEGRRKRASDCGARRGVILFFFHR